MEVFDLKQLKISIKLNQKGDMLAQVELRYGPLRIFGYRVMRSEYEDGLYVNPPSVRAGSTWLWLVRIDNPETWNKLQGMIKNAYLKEVKKYNEDISGDIEDGILEEEMEDPFST